MDDLRLCLARVDMVFSDDSIYQPSAYLHSLFTTALELQDANNIQQGLQDCAARYGKTKSPLPR